MHTHFWSGTWSWEARTVCLIFSCCTGNFCFSDDSTWIPGRPSDLILYYRGFMLSPGHFKNVKISDSHIINTEQPNAIGVYRQTPAGFTGTRFLPPFSREGHLYDLVLKEHKWNVFLCTSQIWQLLECKEHMAKCLLKVKYFHKKKKILTLLEGSTSKILKQKET